MKKILSACVLASAVTLAALFALSPRAEAGTRGGATMFIDTVGRMAQGTLATVRKSADTFGYIGCKVIGTSTGSLTTTCTARNTAGTVSVSCTSSSPQIASAAAAINGDSFLRFYWNSSSQCTQVEAENSSSFEPKLN